MNFATVRQYKGQKDDKGYSQKVDMDGTVNHIQRGSYQGKPNMTVFVTDAAGEAQQVLLMGTLPSDGILNQLAPFAISVKGQPGSEKYQGFWQSRRNIGAVVTNALNPAALQTGQQVAATLPPVNNTPQPTYHPVGADTPATMPTYGPTPAQTPQSDYDVKEAARTASICRQCAGKAAAEIVARQSGNNLTEDIANLVAIAGPLSHWFITGKWPDVPMDEYATGQQPAEQTATDEQGNPLPF